MSCIALLDDMPYHSLNLRFEFLRANFPILYCMHQKGLSKCRFL